VVSTRVGGVPKIIPEDMISFAAPADGTFKTLHPDFDLDVFRVMAEVIAHKAREHDPYSAPQRIRGFHDWTRVTERTETVYRDMLVTPP
jgi:phosphatidylinositol N-acetylglucosaminyltransferase subunit A